MENGAKLEQYKDIYRRYIELSSTRWLARSA